MKFISLFLVIAFISCQSAPRHHSRAIASNGKLFTTFLKEFKKEAKIADADFESKILAYLKGSNEAGPVAHEIGMTQAQMEQVKSLSDDLVDMPRIHRWLAKNMKNVFPDVDESIIQKVYKEVILTKRDMPNEYALAESASSHIRSRAKTPGLKIDKKQQAIMQEIKSLDSANQKKILQENLSVSLERASESRRIVVNAQDIIESSALIYKKTGIISMGKGCKEFMKSAPEEAMQNKALIDILTLEEVEQMAYAKNQGEFFASYKNIPAEKRLSAEDIDKARTRAIATVLKQSDDKAAQTLKELKKSPCDMY